MTQVVAFFTKSHRPGKSRNNRTASSHKTYLGEQFLNVILVGKGVEYLNKVLDERRPREWIPPGNISCRIQDRNEKKYSLFKVTSLGGYLSTSIYLKLDC